ncbi:MAG: hypothetical protein KKA54_12470 [Proteobacteria bacterium]|nr:hypothetical protein [Pseudomonadota bacterium]MBU0967179.1 hypothetical protein [Pseudomonadota bacterium]
MKTLHKKLLGFAAALLSLPLLSPPLVPSLWAMDEAAGDIIVRDDYAKRISYHRYSNLAELVTLICDDASGVFQGFYGAEAVEVSPFAVVSDYKVHKMTMIGITLADQMAAMINREPGATYLAENKYTQKMEGVIEEMDGYLRVHISGRNLRGEGRSYVVNVEMSEPIYRFLHSYVESYKNN